MVLPSYQKVSVISVDLVERLSSRQMPDIEMGQKEGLGVANTWVSLLPGHSWVPASPALLTSHTPDSHGCTDLIRLCN